MGSPIRFSLLLLPATSVTVPYSSAQTAGDLNIVVVGWNDSATRIGSLKDSKGNIYQLAVGPTVTGALSQSIYYAKNIAAASAAANAVTVTFSGLASYPDIRILEYSGIDTVNPVDTFAGAIGNRATSVCKRQPQRTCWWLAILSSRPASPAAGSRCD
jgi:hypothetical protein